MIILIDADNVIENLTHEMFLYIDELYGTDAHYEELRDWDLCTAFPALTREQVYGAELNAELYDRVKPIEGAVGTIRRLIDDGHEVFVVTNTPAKAYAPKTEKVFARYFPFIPSDHYILTSHKQMIRGDVLIDDGIHNLVGGTYAKLLFNAPNNMDYDAGANGMIRVADWDDIYRVISGLNEDKEITKHE